MLPPTEAPSETYRPTVGVRILECESELPSTAQRVPVEIWDVSGDTKTSKVWPAIKKDAVGVVLVYNPEQQNAEQDCEDWFNRFPRQMGLNANQVLVVQSFRRSDNFKRMPLPNKLRDLGVAQPAAVTGDDLPSIKKPFAQFLEVVRQSVQDKQRQEEEDVMKGG